jgi:hypothetical protein
VANLETDERESMSMKPQNDYLSIQRVENGWVVTASTVYQRREGFLPDGTFVADTPQMLANLMLDWADAQLRESKTTN